MAEDSVVKSAFMTAAQDLGLLAGDVNNTFDTKKRLSAMSEICKTTAAVPTRTEVNVRHIIDMLENEYNLLAAENISFVSNVAKVILNRLKTKLAL